MSKEDNSWEELEVENLPKEEEESALASEEADETEETAPEETDTDEEDDGESGAPAQKSSEVKEDKKPSRRDKRIQQLWEQNKEKETRLKEYEEKLAKLEETNFNTEKQTITAKKESLKSSIAAQKDAYKKAAEENDYDKMADINSELTKLNVRYEALEAYESKKPEKFTKPETKTKSELPLYASEWVEENTWFNKDPVKTAAAIDVNNELIQKGYDPNTEEFYAKVSERLNKKYGSLFGDMNKSVVELEKRDSEEPSSTKTVNSKKPVHQIVSGGSRTPKIGGKAVSLTPEELSMAEMYDMTPEEYSKYKKQAENKDTNGYSIIA